MQHADIEPYESPALLRQIAEERAQHYAFVARQYGTGEACESDDDAPRAPGWMGGLVMLLSCVASVSFLYAVLS